MTDDIEVWTGGLINDPQGVRRTDQRGERSTTLPGHAFFPLLLAIAVASCSPKPTTTNSTSIPAPTPTPLVSPAESAPTITPSPSQQPTLTPTCEETNGRLEKMKYGGYVSVEELGVNVYLPPCYRVDDREYPALFLLHGYPLDENHWLDLGIVESVEEGYSAGVWSPFLIVMPEIPADLNVNTDGGEGSYEDEFLNGLIPFIEDRYRIQNGAKNRALAGVSRGGVWALEIGLRNANMFGSVAALSPALHVNHPRPAYDPFRLIVDSQYQPKRLFLSAGLDEGGFHDKTVEFVLLLEELRVAHTFLETPGAHVNSTWIGVMDDFLVFITEKW